MRSKRSALDSHDDGARLSARQNIRRARKRAGTGVDREHPTAGRERAACTADLSDESNPCRHRVTELYIGDREGVRVCEDRKSTRLNSSHTVISYAVFCLKKKNQDN